MRLKWLDVVPGKEAVDMGDLAGEFGSGVGREMWLSRAELEAGGEGPVTLGEHCRTSERSRVEAVDRRTPR